MPFSVFAQGIYGSQGDGYADKVRTPTICRT